MAKRSSRSAARPEIVGGIPANRHIFRKCREILAVPDIYDDAAIELAAWIINNIPFPKLSGREIAAMVDFHAVRRKTISQGAEFVCDMLGGQYSLDAILQAHKRYGRTSAAIRDEAMRLRRQYESEKDDDSVLTEEEQHWLDQHIQKFKRLVELEKEYRAAKKDLFGQSVLATD